jgi:hypothetical protein
MPLTSIRDFTVEQDIKYKFYKSQKSTRLYKGESRTLLIYMDRKTQVLQEKTYYSAVKSIPFALVSTMKSRIQVLKAQKL